DVEIAETFYNSVTRRILVGAGYEVLEAADAAQARAAVDAGRRIDILVSDVIMPGMLGHDLARLLRETSPGLPVVFMSGFTGDDLPTDLLDARSRFVAKPFAAAELVGAVAELVAGAGLDGQDLDAAAAPHDAGVPHG
ncbi:MAG: response regulator, partial [Chloroflexota bacterium]